MEASYIEKRFMVVIEKLSGCSLHDVTPEEEKLPTITTHYTPILPMYPIDTCNGPISDLNHLLDYYLLYTFGFGAALPRSPKSNSLFGRPNRLLLYITVSANAPNPIVY